MVSRIALLGFLIGLFVIIGLLPGCDKLITEQNDITVVDSTLGAACIVCHTDANDTVIVVPRDQWANSAHASTALLEAIVTIDDSAFFTSTCGPVCHSGNGFVDSIEYDKSPINSQPSVINCFTCHLPHTGKYGSWALDTLRGQFNPLIMRNLRPYGYGRSTLCAVCHQAKEAPPTGTDDVTLTPGWGPHSSPQADIYSAKGGYQFGIVMDSGAHNVTVMRQGCITCHFGEGQGYDYGEHTFRLQYDAPKDTTPYLANCNTSTCHVNKPVTSFSSFDSAGVIQNYLDTLRNHLEIFGALDSTSGDPTKINVDSSISIQTARLLYNYLLVQKDGTHGLHNPRFVSKLLHESVIRVDSIPPQARFITIGDTAGCAPVTVTFQNTSRGKFDTFTWDFGDNTSTTTDTMPTHTYDTAGVFDVRLTVEGPGGTSIYLRPGGVISGGIPNARIAIPTTRGCAPDFFFTMVDSTVGLVDSVLWNVTGAITETSSQRTFSVPLPAVGTYPLDIKLTVFNECGTNTDSTSVSAVVDTALDVRFVGLVNGLPDTLKPNDTILVGDSVLYINLTDTSRGGILSSWWQFGRSNGDSLNINQPGKKGYTQPFTNSKVYLKMRNGCGTSYSDTLTLTIMAPGIAPPKRNGE